MSNSSNLFSAYKKNLLNILSTLEGIILSNLKVKMAMYADFDVSHTSYNCNLHLLDQKWMLMSLRDEATHREVDAKTP